MKARPFHFNAASVRANLAGRKTVTRRPMKPQPPAGCTIEHVEGRGGWESWLDMTEQGVVTYVAKPPRFKPGDVFYMAERVEFLHGRIEHEDGKLAHIRYLADDSSNWRPVPKRVRKPKQGIWRGRTIPPEWARDWRGIITDVRPEKLGNMSIDDAWKEGLKPLDTPNITGDEPTVIDRYVELWNSIYKTKWHPDTWVWRYVYEEYQG